MPAAFRRRVLLYFASRDLIPFYGIYALLFADSGLSAGEISSLLIIWSTTSFLFEVPSGAWADVVDRRRLLVLSAGLYTAGFASWTVWPTYAGFVTGFVLWGISGALMSGTFEAYLYDELVATGTEGSYASLLGAANAAAMVATVVGIGLGGPLYEAGGYAAVGWASVAVAATHGVLAWSLPRPPRAVGATQDTAGSAEPGPDSGGSAATRRYVTMLRAGLHEATRHSTVRHVVLIAAVLMGVSAYDEYFGLLAQEAGAETSDVALLMGVVTAGQLAGAALGGRTQGMPRRAMATAVMVAGSFIAAGALSGHPSGIVAVAVGYGIVQNAIVVSEARVQTVIAGPARATVTSTVGFSAEVFAVGCYAAFAAGAPWLAVSTLVALLCLPLLGISAAIGRWWPDQARDTPPESCDS